MLDKETYKSHYAPTCLFMGYVLGTIACFVGLDFLRHFLNEADLGLGFFNGVLRTVIFLAAYLFAGLGFCWIFMSIFGYRSNKIYRGIAFYRFMNIILLVPVAIIITVVVLGIATGKSVNLGSLFNCIALIGELLIPFFIRFACYAKCFIRKCPSCGLINSMSTHSITDEHVDTSITVADEGVMFVKPVAHIYSNREVTTTLKCDICGGFDKDKSYYKKQI